ncbi:TIGR03089 family protein [Kribbella solani]|uniref:TIGR03089 family protein n=1 Tax=Kribbella solani TaxID=236067 RepID=UPI0029A7F917|nr:TIGR03089 family protein [Kribbella solani]MDX2970996.1 TIGR03089 family protein [Kribbella solani]MDX3002731.1 TIGR03089 family protein [Kribbella solani]
MSRILPELFAAAVRRDGGAPFLTHYDDASGERIELSAVTTANWVAKTANLLVDEYDLETGETVAIGLPPHWLGVVWALSAWSAGAGLTSGTGTLAITGPDVAIRGERETIASALLPLGGRFREPLPDGVHDFGAEVYNHPDLFVPFDPPTPTSPAYDELTHEDLIGTAEPVRDRILVTRTLTDRDGLALLVGVISGGGSIVLCRNLDTSKLERRVADEKVDRVLSQLTEG